MAAIHEDPDNLRGWGRRLKVQLHDLFGKMSPVATILPSRVKEEWQPIVADADQQTICNQC